MTFVSLFNQPHFVEGGQIRVIPEGNRMSEYKKYTAMNILKSQLSVHCISFSGRKEEIWASFISLHVIHGYLTYKI